MFIVILLLGISSVFGEWPSSFDEVTTETYAGRDIGWKKVMGCSGTKDSEIWEYPVTDKGVSIAPYAITFKMVPSDITTSDATFDDYAIYAMPCQNAVFSLNNLKIVSFIRDTSSLSPTGFMTAGGTVTTNYHGSTTSLGHAWNSCGTSTVGGNSWTEGFYHACNNGGGMHIYPDGVCGWTSGGGSSIDIYFGFDANKQDICDGTATGGFVSAPTTSSAAVDCDVLVIDRFLLQCSAEFADHTDALTDLSDNIDLVSTSIAALETDISANTAAILVNTNDITTASGDIATNAVDIATLQSDVSTGNTALDTRMTDVETAVDRLAGLSAGSAAGLNFDATSNLFTSLSVKDLIIFILLLVNSVISVCYLCSKGKSNKIMSKNGYSVTYNHRNDESDVEEPMKM